MCVKYGNYFKILLIATKYFDTLVIVYKIIVHPFQQFKAILDRYQVC